VANVVQRSPPSSFARSADRKEYYNLHFDTEAEMREYLWYLATLSGTMGTKMGGASTGRETWVYSIELVSMGCASGKLVIVMVCYRSRRL
jgi:hypothetical protein